MTYLLAGSSKTCVAFRISVIRALNSSEPLRDKSSPVMIREPRLGRDREIRNRDMNPLLWISLPLRFRNFLITSSWTAIVTPKFGLMIFSVSLVLRTISRSSLLQSELNMPSDRKSADSRTRPPSEETIAAVGCSSCNRWATASAVASCMSSLKPFGRFGFSSSICSISSSAPCVDLPDFFRLDFRR
ncbi:hypothetical protein D9M72_493790 [compost metagenome]